MSRATCHAVRRICQGAAPTPRWGTGGSPMTPTSTGSRTPGAKAHPTFAIPVASVRALSNVAVEGERLSVRRDVLPCQEPLCPSEPRLSGAVFSSIRQPAPVSHGSVKADVVSVRAATTGSGRPGSAGWERPHVDPVRVIGAIYVGKAAIETRAPQGGANCAEGLGR